MIDKQPKTDNENTTGRRGRTRRALLVAGEQLFAENYGAVSVDDLVASAGVAKGTFYNHFTDKADLFQAVVSHVRDNLRSTILSEISQGDDPARKCVLGFCISIRYMLMHPQQRRIILASQQILMSHLNEVNDGIVSFMAEGIAQGRFRIPTVEAGVLLNFGLVQICASLELDESDGFALIARIQQLGAVLLRGLGINHEEAEALSAQETDRTIRTLFSSPDKRYSLQKETEPM